MKRKLTNRQENFAVAYVKTDKATESYRQFYSTENMKPETVHNRAYALTQHSGVAARVESLRKKVSEKLDVTVQDIVAEWQRIAFGDPRELVTHRRVCCRHCFGRDHQYQWRDEMEFADALADALEKTASYDKLEPRWRQGRKRPKMPDDSGGYNYNPTITPHPLCTRCFGEGRGEVLVADISKVTSSAKTLYIGAEQTRHGIKISIRDKDRALENLAKFNGMFKDKLSTPPAGSGAVPDGATSRIGTDPVEASRTYQQIMSGN